MARPKRGKPDRAWMAADRRGLPTVAYCQLADEPRHGPFADLHAALVHMNKLQQERETRQRLEAEKLKNAD